MIPERDRPGAPDPEPPTARTADDGTPRAARHPAHVVVLLLDSLNRHHLGCYGGVEFDTPNLDRFAQRAVRFTRHYTGALPCMPARHDIVCGALDFLWRPWGSIEVWETPMTHDLARAGVTTMLVSDHPHLFEAGGENYHTDFTAWEYLRGHEGDPWRTVPDPTWAGAPALPARSSNGWHAYDRSRTWFRAEDDFPGPRTMRAAAEWWRTNRGHHDRSLLFVDEFDPHEPFDVPEPWARRYDDDPTREELLIWPPYLVGAVASGALSERDARHIRANYGSKVTMIDHWLGVVLDELDASGAWADTAVVVCTDHGHYLGEKDIWGKPGVMQYEPLGHTPLLVAWPGVAGGGTCDALTTNVDLHATLCDVFDVAPVHPTHGRSLVPLLTGERDEIREWALGGVWGNWVQVTDGARKYARAPVVDNFPLAMWSNRWSTMPIHALPELRLPRPDHRATLEAMPGTDVPVIRQPFEPGDPLPYWAGRDLADRHHCFRVSEDPDEVDDRRGTPLEREMIDLLRAALDEVVAPPEQYERLGLD